MAEPETPEAVLQDEIRWLVAAYLSAVKKLASGLVAGFSIEDGRVLALVRAGIRTLERLDVTAAAWAERNILGAYNRSRRATAARIVERGLSRREPGAVRKYAPIHRAAIAALVLDPDVGFLSLLRVATDGVRRRLRLIQSQARMLRLQDRVLDDAIARVGVLEAATLDRVKRELVRELTSARAGATQSLRPKLIKLGRDNVFANLADLPYVKFPTKLGQTSIRLDRYVSIVARAKATQAVTMGQRNALMEHGRDLIQISRNPPKEDDACNLFIGRVFALTQKAANDLNVPHVSQLPGGSAPFHQNCVHRELPFFPEVMRPGVIERAFSRPPDWALGKTWNEVSALYFKKGGAEDNPNIRRQSAVRAKKGVTVMSR